MNTNTQSAMSKSVNREASGELAFDLTSFKNGSEHLVKSVGVGDYQHKHESEHWENELDPDWQYIASDYSVQYKRMHKRFHSLHNNKLSIDLHKITDVGECKVADITRCSYAMQEDQCIRVSVHATLVFMQ